MGQKVNPISLRLNSTNRQFDNCWYSDFFYKNLLTKDIFLHNYFDNFLKLLKLASGRYSIQHLQKQTQIYNFLWYSKSTREWRSKLFGLTKNQILSKKEKYFIKNQTEIKKRNQKLTPLNFYYKSLNQITIYKFQKKIKSFQNFNLWSKFLKYNQNSEIYKKDLLFNKVENTFIIDSPVEKIYQFNDITKISDFKNQKVLKKPFETTNLGKRKLEKQEFTRNLRFFQNLLIYNKFKTNLSKQWFIKNNQIDSNINFLYKDLFNLKYLNYLDLSTSSFYNLQTNFLPFKVKNEWQNANYLADEIVYFLEKRLPFRRLKSKILKQLSKIQAIRGVRITCSGRVGGKSKKAQRSKTESIKYGQTCLQVFSAKIDFASKTAFTSFGSVGVKVWICYN